LRFRSTPPTCAKKKLRKEIRICQGKEKKNQIYEIISGFSLHASVQDYSYICSSHTDKKITPIVFSPFKTMLILAFWLSKVLTCCLKYN
jgi:hypothetical protein